MQAGGPSRPLARHRRAKRGLLLAALAIGLVACATQAPAATTTQAPAATTTDAGNPGASAPPSTAPTTPSAFEVEVDGLTIVGHCSGERGPDLPAVLLEHGGGGSQSHLAVLEAYLVDRTLVCAYDRPGGAGRSDPPARRPQPIADVVARAHGVLAAAGVAPPYVVIGQSLGAEIATVFAHTYPGEVAGFVAINPRPPFHLWIETVSEVETPEEVETLEIPDLTGQTAGESIDSTNNDIMLEPLPASMPFAILFDEDCGGDTAFCDRILEPLARVTEMLADAGAGGRFIWVEGAGHDIHVTRPDAVQAAIDAVWEDAVGG